MVDSKLAEVAAVLQPVKAVGNKLAVMKVDGKESSPLVITAPEGGAVNYFEFCWSYHAITRVASVVPLVWNNWMWNEFERILPMVWKDKVQRRHGNDWKVLDSFLEFTSGEGIRLISKIKKVIENYVCMHVVEFLSQPRGRFSVLDCSLLD